MIGPLNITSESLALEAGQVQRKLAAGIDTLRQMDDVHFGVTAREDHVSEVIDYDFIRREIHEWACSRHFNLQETLLDGIVDICFAQPAVRAVCASTEKPDVYPDCRTVGIEVFRFRP